jgi:hypothetical protein
MSTIETALIERQKASVHPSLRDTARQRRLSLGDRIVRDLARKGLLPFRFSLADDDAVWLARLLEDVDAAWGGSGALKSPMFGGAVGSGGAGPIGQPPIPADEMQRVTDCLRKLHRHERELVHWLLSCRGRRGLTAANLGAELWGLTEERQAYNQANGALRMLASSISEHYRLLALPRRAGPRLIRATAPAEP